MYKNCKALEKDKDKTGRKEGQIGNCGLKRAKKSNG
jgi:hypothetical protein